MELRHDTPESLAWQRVRSDAARDELRGWPHFEALVKQVEAEGSTIRDFLVGQPRLRGGRWFDLRPCGEGGPLALYVSKRAEEPGEVLVDPIELGRQLGHDTAGELTWFEPAPDGRHVAFTVGFGGEMVGSWRVVDVDRRELLDLDLPARTFTGGLPGWLPDSSGFLLADRTESGRHCVHTVRLGEGALSTAQLEAIPAVVSGLQLQVSPSGRWAVAVSTPHERSALALGDLATGTWQPLLPAGFHGELNGCWLDGDTYLAVDTDAAPRGRLVTIPVTSSADRCSWQELVPAGTDVLRAVTVIDESLVVAALRDVSVVFSIYDRQGRRLRELPLPQPGSSPGVFLLRRFDSSDALTFSWTTFFSSPQSYRYDIGWDELSLLTPSERTVDGCVVEQRWVGSAAGADVPYFVLRRGDLGPGPAPTLIYAYGGFNIAWLPRYLGHFATFVRAGGVLVHACLRGGAEFGKDWYDAGRLANKENTFDDLFAVAEQVVADGLADPARLAFKGESNGGMLAGVALTRRPDLWSAVVADVPLFDLLDPFTTDSPTTQAIAAILWEDYGNPAVPEQRAWLERYSPLHHVRADVAYPPLLSVFGAEDIGCPPFHGRLMTDRLEHAGTRPLLRVWDGVGHGGPTDPHEAALQVAEWLGFLMRELQLEPVAG